MLKGEVSRVPQARDPVTLTWYSQAEAARLAGVTRQYIWRLVRDEKLASHRRGGKLYVDGLALVAWIARRKEGRG